MLGDSGLCWLRDLGVGVTMGLMIEIPHSLHTYQVYFIHILSVSAPATVASGHKDDATPHRNCPLGPESECCWYWRWVSVSSYD